ncbi:MAG TPA: hypothetical protein DCQ64_26575 [Candidatus Rokubacteria bacterium]|nr:hypothetical protein [Candidatus Rokubacteria bacterium]
MSKAGRKKGVYTTVDVPCTFCGEMLHLEPGVASASANHFCSRAHFGLWKSETALRNRSVLFWSHVPDTPGGDECWEWQGSKNDVGYGFMGGAKTKVYAHRWSYASFIGPIPDGAFVCHHCDNPACVRPSHLFVGTQAENMADCAAKKRARTRPMPGETNPFARLTNSDVRDIRERLSHGDAGVDIARSHGVSQSTVSHIKNGRSWATVLPIDHAPRGA